jgi:hypothetical protein
MTNRDAAMQHLAQGASHLAQAVTLLLSHQDLRSKVKALYISASILKHLTAQELQAVIEDHREQFEPRTVKTVVLSRGAL